MKKADIGVIGLAVMGQNLILNMNDHGYKVAAYNRSTAKVDEFLQGAAKGTQIIGAHSLQELADSLEKPRIIMLMVRAGDAVDQTVAQLLPYLEPGDIIIDGGNSHYPDTNRRVAALREQGIRYLGVGVSGGEEGARHGPSIMPGGNADAWPHVKPILQAIAAKTKDGEPCCDWVGADGAGHFVKMVHNGIEYGDMQLICEAYHILKDGLGLTYPEMHAVFADWKKTELDSYLIDITADILAYKDEDGAPLVEKILDTAGQKGTGKWTGINALDHGIPLTLITEAVFARCVSALKDQREAAAQTFGKSIARIDGDRAAWTETLRQALLAAKIISYAQGFMLIREASEQNGWHIDYGATALLWREGCIIRSRFLGDIRDEFDVERESVEWRGLDICSIDAKLLLEEVDDLLGVCIVDEDVDSIGGWLYDQLGEAPRVGQMAAHAGALLYVEEVEGIRITRVLLRMPHTMLVVQELPAASGEK